MGLRPGSRLPCGLQPISALGCQALDRSIYTVVDFQACWNQCRLTGHRLLSSTTHDLNPRKNSSISMLDDSVYWGRSFQVSNISCTTDQYGLEGSSVKSVLV